ncbi:hypothetical protein IJ732_06700 [bacterium]|nr:hypothetical protein [bacterium]
MASPIGTYQTNIPSGVNIQIFNPCPPCQCEYDRTETNYMTSPVYPSNYYTKDFTKTEISEKTEKTETTKTTEEPKFETAPQKKVTKLTDEYIKKLENYLSSKDVEKRILASKDILERVQEDDSRKDNIALTALTNKMLKDPYQPIRFLALGMLEERLITGNAETVETLKKVETGRYSKNGNTDQDAIKASSVLLKMTRKVQE